MLHGDPSRPQEMRLRSFEGLDRKMQTEVERSGLRYVSVQQIERENGWPVQAPNGDLAGAEWIVRRWPALAPPSTPVAAAAQPGAHVLK